MKNLIKKIFDHPELQKRPYLKQFLKFCIVGGLNTILDFVIYIGLTRPFVFWEKNYILAGFVSFIFAATSSYFLNKTWTFRDRQSKITKQYPKFLLISTIGLLLNLTTLYLLVSQFKIYDLIAKIIAVILVTFWNFIMNKIWTFKPDKNRNNQTLSDLKI